MSRFPSRTVQPVTVDEFVRLVPDGQKADLLDGVIHHVTSPDSPRSADVNVFLVSLMDLFVRRFQLGKIYGPRSAFRLSKTYAPESDIAFVRAGRLHLWKGCIFQGPPDIAVESVAPDSIERDTVLKRDAYERFGVPEYRMLHLIEGRCAFRRLEGEKHVEVPLESGRVFRSAVLPGFWLDTGWVLSGEPPSPEECMARIARSPPMGGCPPIGGSPLGAGRPPGE